MGRNIPEYSKLKYSGKTISVKIGKYLLHGLIIFLGFYQIEAYVQIMFVNAAFGSYIPFMNHILMICIFLVFLLFGALNRIVTVKLWNLDTSSNWLFLILQGIVLFVLTVITVIAFSYFSIYGLSYLIYGSPYYYVPIQYYGLTIPLIGFLSKVLISIGSGIKDNQSKSELEQ